MKVGYKVSKVTYGTGYAVTFYLGGYPDLSAHGTSGTGCKIFETKEQAVRSGKRYVKTMNSRGFETEDSKIFKMWMS